MPASAGRLIVTQVQTNLNGYVVLHDGEVGLIAVQRTHALRYILFRQPPCWCVSSGSFIATHELGSRAPEPERDVLPIDVILTRDVNINLYVLPPPHVDAHVMTIWPRYLSTATASCYAWSAAAMPWALRRQTLSRSATPGRTYVPGSWAPATAGRISRRMAR